MLLKNFSLLPQADPQRSEGFRKEAIYLSG
jgi:hypothetical protein